jgi:hypothetical protein
MNDSVAKLAWVSNVVNLVTPVLRYSEEPDRTEEESGSSEYLRTGLENRTN